MKLSDLRTLTWVIRPRHKKLKPDSIENLRSDVNFLAGLFEKSDFNVYLVGGVGMAIRGDTYYRNHRDLDVAIFSEDLEKILIHLQALDYRVMSKHFSTHISPWHNMQIVSRFDKTENLTKNPDLLKVRVIKKGRALFRYARHRVDYFDVFFLGRTKEGVILHGYNAIVPWGDFLPTNSITDESNLILPNIRYKQYLPPKKKKEKTDFEVAGIEPVYSSVK